MISQKEEYHKLLFYTLEHSDMNYFIHQHVVDVFQAQHAHKNTKPIALFFSLIGLYLFLEKGFTGRQVQLAHMKLAQNKKKWPLLHLPVQRGAITVSDVLNSEPGHERDQMIKEWCSSVWQAYKNWHSTIADFANAEPGIC